MKRSAWLQRPGCVWAAAGAAAGVLVLAVVLAVTAVSRGATGSAQVAPPVVTLLPRPSPTVVVPPSPTALPTGTPAPAAPSDGESGRIGVGLIVEVHGTQGDGLRLRVDPGTVAAIRLIAGESEVFVVQDGPVEAEGRTWFLLASPSDPARTGWAVADYLRLAQ